MLYKRLGIDLGTANSLVYLVGRGIVLNEPTVVAVANDDNRIVAIGNEAKEMLGRTPGNVVASRPLKDGVIANYEETEALIRYFIDRVCGKNRFFKPEVMVSVPGGSTQVERRAVVDAVLDAGARAAYLIEEPLAAAIGAKIPIAAPSGNMIVDIGGGSSEAAIISLGGIVVHRSVRMAGNKLDEAITSYVRRKYNLVIGERTAEEVKIAIGNALIEKKSEAENDKSRPRQATSYEVRGRDALTGLPRLVSVTDEEIASAMQNVLTAIISAIKGVLEEIPPELASDVIDKGIVLSGGTSMLRNFDILVTQVTGVPAHVAEHPLLCVVRGTGVAIENIELYKRSISRR